MSYERMIMQNNFSDDDETIQQTSHLLQTPRLLPTGRDFGHSSGTHFALLNLSDIIFSQLIQIYNLM